VLHYLAKLVKRNDESLIDFPKDLAHVGEAENVMMDFVINEIKSLQNEIENIHETVRAQADGLEESGEAKPLSLKELQEQRSSVRKIGNVPQYNKIDHLTGRTPMERFSLNAAASVNNVFHLSEAVREKYKKLLEYFGEDENMASNAFFGTMRRFIAEFGKAVEQVLSEEQKKVRAYCVWSSCVKSRELNLLFSQLKEENRALKKAAASPAKKGPPAGGSFGTRDSQVPVVVDGGKLSTVSGIAKNLTDKGDSEAKSVLAMHVTGIAAMAAAAATAKKDRHVRTQVSGIAAAAAAADQKRGASSTDQHVPVANLAALNTTSALKRGFVGN
jgi:hypothetical protein